MYRWNCLKYLVHTYVSLHKDEKPGRKNYLYLGKWSLGGINAQAAALKRSAIVTDGVVRIVGTRCSGGVLDHASLQMLYVYDHDDVYESTKYDEE